MRLEGTYVFDAPIETVWATLMDPEALSQALPGGERLEQVGDNKYEATLNVRVGPVQGKFDGAIEITDIVEKKSYHMKVSGQGPAGFVNGAGDIALEETADGVKMTYGGDAQVGGKIAGVGQRLIDSSAKSITRQGLESLNQQIKARVGVAADAPAPPPISPPSTTKVAATLARDVSADLTGDLMERIMKPEIMPYTLGVGALVLTLLVALISWLIAG